MSCSYGLADRPVLQASQHLIPVAALFELAACAVLITDRRRAPRRLYKKFVVRPSWPPSPDTPNTSPRLTPPQLAGMTLSILIFFCAAVQWRFGFQQYGPALADRTRRGVVYLGHATWTAVLAVLLEALREGAVAAADAEAAQAEADAALSAAGDDQEAACWADERKIAIVPTTAVDEKTASVEVMALVPVAAEATAVPMPEPVRVPSPVEV